MKAMHTTFFSSLVSLGLLQFFQRILLHQFFSQAASEDSSLLCAAALSAPASVLDAGWEVAEGRELGCGTHL